MVDASRSGPGLALAAAALFGFSAPAAKLLAGSVDPWLLAGLLYLGSGIGLGLYRLAQRLAGHVGSEAPATPTSRFAWTAHNSTIPFRTRRRPSFRLAGAREPLPRQERHGHHLHSGSAILHPSGMRRWRSDRIAYRQDRVKILGSAGPPAHVSGPGDHRAAASIAEVTKA